MIYFFMMLYIVEIILGGGGTILSYKSISLRHINFIILIFFSLFYLKGKRDKRIDLIIFSFIFITMLSFFIGLLNSADINLIIIDFKTFLGVLITLPLSIFLEKKKSETIVKILENSILILGIGYFILNILFIMSNAENYLRLYNFFRKIGENEILIAGNRIFYKGIIFLNIGFIFSALKKQNKRMIFYFILICLSQTRGFFIGLILVFFIKFFIIEKMTNIKILKALSTFLIIIFLGSFFYDKIIYIFSKPVSDIDRIIQIHQVIERIDYKSFLIGHGFGIGVPIRPIHFEISYLEIFHKQGILGLLFWMIIIIYQTKIIKRNYSNIEYKNMLCFYLSSCFVYFQSLTNPYLTNPLGITFIFLSLVLLLVKDKNINKLY